MKKIIAIALSLTVILGSVSIVYGEYNEEVGIRINGLPLIMDDLDQNTQLNALIIEDRTMAPLRPIFDKFGLELTWNSSDSSITTVTPDGRSLWMQIDNPVAKLDGKDYQMDIGPKVLDDRTYIPVKYLFDFLGLEYSWDGDNRVVNVSAPLLMKFETSNSLKALYGEATIISEDKYIITQLNDTKKSCIITVSKLSYDSEIQATANRLGIASKNLIEVQKQDYQYNIFRIENIYSGLVIEKDGSVYSVEIRNMTNEEIDNLLNDL